MHVSIVIRMTRRFREDRRSSIDEGLDGTVADATGVARGADAGFGPLPLGVPHSRQKAVSSCSLNLHFLQYIDVDITTIMRSINNR